MSGVPVLLTQNSETIRDVVQKRFQRRSTIVTTLRPPWIDQVETDQDFGWQAI